MFQMVAFDLDGTIADTIPMCIKAFRNSVAPYTDHVLCEEEILRTLFFGSMAGIIACGYFGKRESGSCV